MKIIIIMMMIRFCDGFRLFSGKEDFLDLEEVESIMLLLFHYHFDDLLTIILFKNYK